MSGQVSVCLLHLLFVHSAAEWCNFNHDSNYESYCSNGCCGRTCCYQLDEESPIPLIVGCTVAGLFVVITVAALVYACLKSNTRPGRVISVGGTTSVNTLTIGSSGGGYTNYSVPILTPQPPPYSLSQPPPYSLYPFTNNTLPYGTTCMMQPPGYSEEPLTLPPLNQAVPCQALSQFPQTAQDQLHHISCRAHTVPNEIHPLSHQVQNVPYQVPPFNSQTHTIPDQVPSLTSNTPAVP